jgi:hypothetical protein
VLATSNAPQHSAICIVIRQWRLPLSAFTISSLQTATFAVVQPSKLHVIILSAREGDITVSAVLLKCTRRLSLFVT